jgi:very-short-patch-repair endonuclease
MDSAECARPGCARPVLKAATGRPGRYCSARCRQAAHRERVRQARQAARRAAELAAARTAVDHIRMAAAGVVQRARSGSRDALMLQINELRAHSDELIRLATGVSRPRREPTSLERWLFAALDEDGVTYHPFARVGRYEADAILPEHKVIVEVDGVRWHRERADYDRRRDAELAAAGYTVVHFTDLKMTSLTRARALVSEMLARIRSGQQSYRPPLLWPSGQLEAT